MELTSVNTFGVKIPKVINLHRILAVFLLQALQVRAGPSRCGAQFKTWAWGPMQDLSAGLSEQ